MSNSDPAWKYFTKQSEWKAYLQNLVMTNVSACLRAIVCIDNRQTEHERLRGESIEENGIGWTKNDAREMGQIASKIRRGVPLSDAELAKSRNKMKKYWKQLMVISKQRLERKEQLEQAEAKARAEEEYQREYEQRRMLFEQALETIRKCSEEGIACEYGICDECPLTQGYQLRLPMEFLTEGEK